jgi:hypothetical protein
MSIKLNIEHIKPCLIENTVITTVTNYGYILYTLNMLKSLKPYQLDDKILIVCIDTKSASIFKKLGYNNIYCIEDESLYKFCPWNSKGYDKICYIKLELIYRILSLKTNVLLIDGDIVFRMNPLDDLKVWCKNKISDVWIQNDSQQNNNTTNMCTGYMFIKSNERLCSLYDCVSENGQKKYMTCAFDNNDQTYFNKYVKPFCIIQPLPLESYPNGKMFYDNHKKILASSILVHFNWVQGHLKMVKMKEYKMWLLTPEEEDNI